MPVVSKGKTAPPFELASTEGEKYSLQTALARGPVLVAFFKVSCPTCQYTFPFLERVFQQFRAKNVQVWGIAQDNARDARLFAKQLGITFPVLIDDQPYKTSRAYSLVYVPTVFLIAGTGEVQVSSEGFAKSELQTIHRSLAEHFSVATGPLFQSNEKIPEYKPG